MSDPFLIKVILSFLVGGIWISIITLIAEHKGSKMGGLIGSLPSTMLISFIFIALTQGIDFVREASRVIPVGQTIDMVFLFALIVLLRYRLRIAAPLALMLWAMLAFLMNSLRLTGWGVTIPLFLAINFIAFYILEKHIKIPSRPKNKKPYRFYQILIRACFAGTVIAVAVIMGRLFGPFWAGIFSAFPAVFLSSMVILTLTQGYAFAQATGKSLLLSSPTVIIYTLAIYYLYPPFGLLWGTVISYAIAFLWACLYYPLVKRIS